MKKLFLAAAIVMSLAAPAAFAQSAAAPSPAAVQAATDMLDAMNFRGMMDASFAQMRQSMPAMMKQAASSAINSNPRLDAAQKAAEIGKLDGELAKQAANFSSVFEDPALLADIARNTAILYARHYTVEEMRQISAFYKSPVGAKMLITMPQMIGESMQMTQTLIMPRIEAMMKKIQAEHGGS